MGSKRAARVKCVDVGEEEEKKVGRGSGSGGSDPQLVEAVRE